ncbi:MAG TPA: hypothetical protein VMW91_11220 [Desulfosporosinus sp.]|nr:hypothetical protein [Desulfosporosinus sp.]
MKNKFLDKIVKFDNLLGITAIVIALVAAFFSVYGIATLFAGAFVLTAFMASSLEIGKLVAVTFLYRYWQKTQGFLKTYLSIATVVLMLVTSMGIFGYLSAAYQKSSLEFKAAQENIVMVEGQKTYLTDKIAQSKVRIQTLNDMRKMQESRMNESITNAFLSRNPIQMKQLNDQTIDLIKTADSNIKTEQDRIQSTTDEIQKINQQVNEMKFASANKKDIRTFQFVADQFGTTLDKVAKWFIFTLIFVFDPLAVALILAYNVAVYKKPTGETEPIKAEFVENPTLVSPPPSPAPSPAPEEPIISKNPEKLEIVDPIPIPSPEVAPSPTPAPEPAPPPASNADSWTRRMFKL